MKFTISKKKWLNWTVWKRTAGLGSSALQRRADGMMCCLGQIGEQCGVSIEKMIGTTTPIVLPDNERKKFPVGLRGETDAGRVLVYRITELNDTELNPRETRAQRLQKIKDLFAEIDIEIEFVP